MSEIKCDRDCLNCKYADCIEDRIASDEYEAQNQMDNEILGKTKKVSKDRREYQHQYYMKRREELNERHKQYFQDNKESIYLQRNAKRRMKMYESKREVGVCI